MGSLVGEDPQRGDSSGGGESGLLLYTEYAAGEDEWRMAFVFVAKVDSDEFFPQDKLYGSFKWISSVKVQPKLVMPYVEGTLPLAFMSVSLDGVPRSP